MCAWIIPPVAGLIEIGPVPEVFFESIGAIEDVGGLVRIYCCTRQMSLGDPQEQQIVAVKILRPLDRLPADIGRVAMCLTERTPGVQGKPRLVR